MIGKIFSKNVILSTLISTVLFFVIVNYWYYYFNGQSMFKEWHYYEWVEYAYGTGTMAVCTFIAEAARGILKKDA